METKTDQKLTTVVLKNYGNKLACDHFVVLDKAPKQGFTYHQLPINIRVENEEKTLSFDARITEMIRYPAIDVPELFSQMSHGIDATQMYSFLLEKRIPDAFGMVAVWLYEKMA